MGAAIGLAGPGCVVTASPEFTAPRLSVPYLTPTEPPPWEIIVMRSKGSSPPVYPTPPIHFNVFSEDLNTTGLTAALVLDYPGPVTARDDPPIVIQPTQQIDPGHLDPASAACVEPCPAPTLRSVEMTLTLPAGTSVGCHSATVLVTHEFLPFLVIPKRSNDLATLTWWLDVQDPLNPSPSDLSTCLTSMSPGGSDAGTGVSP